MRARIAEVGAAIGVRGARVALEKTELVSAVDSAAAAHAAETAERAAILRDGARDAVGLASVQTLDISG
jgi:hypothetical protein